MIGDAVTGSDGNGNDNGGGKGKGCHYYSYWLAHEVVYWRRAITSQMNDFANRRSRGSLFGLLAASTCWHPRAW